MIYLKWFDRETLNIFFECEDVEDLRKYFAIWNEILASINNAYDCDILNDNFYLIHILRKRFSGKYVELDFYESLL